MDCRVRCLSCGVFIPKANKCIEQHLNGARHTESIALMNENAISFAIDGLKCKPCNRSLLHEETVLKHIECEDHANWIAAMDDLIDGEFININNYLSSEAAIEAAYCEVCDCYLDCSLQGVEAHVNNIDHRTKIVNRLKPLNAIFSIDNEDVAWCKVCDVYMDDNIRNILNHIDDDERHMQWFTEIEDLIEDEEITVDVYLANQGYSYAVCHQCHVEVLCTIPAIQSHLNSEAHLNHFGL